MQTILRCLLALLLCVPLLTHPAPARARPPAQSDNASLACLFGTTYLSMGLVVDARRLLEQAAEAFARGPDARTLEAANCYLWLGIHRHSLADYNGALAVYEQARAIFQAQGDRQMTWTTTFAIGVLTAIQGDLDGGEAILRDQALPLAQDPAGWPSDELRQLAEATTRNNLSVTRTQRFNQDVLTGQIDQQTALAELEAARQEMQAARDIFRKLASRQPAGDVPVAVPGLLGPVAAGEAIDPSLLIDLLHVLEVLTIGGGLEQLDEASFERLIKLSMRLDAQPAADPTGEDPRMLIAILPLLLSGLGNGDLNQMLDSLDELEDQGLIDSEAASQMREVFDLIGKVQNADGTDENALIEVFGGAGDYTAQLAMATARSMQPIIVNNLGEIERLRLWQSGADDYSSAQKIFDEALALIDQEQSSGSALVSSVYFDVTRGLIFNNKGLSSYLDGDNATALRFYGEALLRMEQAHQRVAIASVLTNRGFIYAKTGEPELALEDYLKAVSILDEVRVIGDSRLTNVPTGSSIQVNNTYALNGAVFQLSDIYNYAVQLSYSQAQGIAGNDAAAATRREELERQAFDLAERGRARLFLELLATNQLEASDSALADLVRAERRSYAELLVARDTLAQMESIDPPSSLVPPAREQVNQAEATHQQIVATIEQHDVSLLNLLSERGGILDSHAVQAEAATFDATMVSYYTYDLRILPNEPALAFVLSAGDFTVVRLPKATPAGLSTIAEVLQTTLVDHKEERHPEILRTLHEMLIVPLEQALPQGDKPERLLGIVPHQQLHYVPFAALTNGTQYLGERYTLFNLPSASTLRVVRQVAETKVDSPSKNVLIYGDPVSQSSNLPALLYAADEASKIGTMLGQQAQLRELATESFLRQQSRTAQIIHLAAHGIYNNAQPLESAIVLSSRGDQDGALQVREIFNMRFPAADLVVLSACRTNVGKLSSGDEIISLTRAFFTAGSPTVISSLWQVNDKATRDLMEAFYLAWQDQGMSKAAALRAAQEQLRATHSPYYWAGMVLSGNPGPGVVRFPITLKQEPTITPTPTFTTEPATPTSLPTDSPPPATATIPPSPSSTSAPPNGPTATPVQPGPPGPCGVPLMILAIAVVGVVYRRRVVRNNGPDGD